MLAAQMFYLQADIPVYAQKVRTPQTIRDYQKVQNRIKSIGPKVNNVSIFIDKYFGTHVTIAILMSLAKIIMSRHQLSLDRLAKRNRSALLCWYAENWDVIYPLLSNPDFERNVKHLRRDAHCQIAKPKLEKVVIEEVKKDYFDPSDLTNLLNFH